jgi:hypothetical protein
MVLTFLAALVGCTALRSRAQLVVANALLRQQRLVLRPQVGRPRPHRRRSLVDGWMVCLGGATADAVVLLTRLTGAVTELSLALAAASV